MVAASRPYGRPSSRLRAPLADSDYGEALTPSQWLSDTAANAIEIWSPHNFQYDAFSA